jgi:FkbM family methyltransferase
MHEWSSEQGVCSPDARCFIAMTRVPEKLLSAPSMAGGRLHSSSYRFTVSIHRRMSSTGLAIAHFLHNTRFISTGRGEVNGSLSFFSPVRSGGMYSTSGKHDNVNNVEVKLPVKTLQTIASELKTECLEILKMDVEGAEYGLLPSIIGCPIPIKQLLIEFHHRIGIESLRGTIAAVNLLRKKGYLLFHVSEASSEFSFLHRSCLS